MIGRLLLLVACAGLVACESMEPSGHPFTPVRGEAPAPTSGGPVGDLTFPTDDLLTLSSEQMAEGTVGIGTAAGVDPDSLPVPVGTEALPSPPNDAAASVPVEAGGEPFVLPEITRPAAPTITAPAVSWPVRLVSTIPQAQPPRAVLGMPDGSERVVSPGSMIPELGLVVMTITVDRVQLAKVTPAGDHAAIDSVEIVAQYPSR